MVDPGERRCVPLEVEPISLHRERRRPRSPRREPSSGVRAVVARLLRIVRPGKG